MNGRSGWGSPRRVPLCIGHRGASDRQTENTLAAFAAARQHGADGVELDVRLCGSGEVVVFHDDDLRRLAARGERIESLPLAALRAVRLPGGHPIPTFDEALEEIGPDMLVNVELKSRRPTRAALVAGVLRVVARHAAAERVLVSSFDVGALMRVRMRAPRLLVGFLFHKKQPVPYRRAWVASVLRPFSVHPEHDLITELSMARWRRAGYRVAAWTVDRPRVARRLAALGVDAIISNDPAAIREAVSASPR